MAVNFQKAAIVGCGFVGSSSAFALMQSGLFNEIVLIDMDRQKAEGEALDISDGVPFVSPQQIHAGDYDDAADAGIIVVTAGAAQKPGETRLDLVHKNISIFKSIIPEISKRNFEGILLIVANPVDILTYTAVKLSGLPENRVIGSGTVLDSARLRSKLGEHLQVDSRSVHAFIIGEHGDNMVPLLSSTTIGGIPLKYFIREVELDIREIIQTLRNAGNTIISKKGATEYGPAYAISNLIITLITNSHKILTVSLYLDGEIAGVKGVSLGVPSVLSKKGNAMIVPIHMNDYETKKFQSAAEQIGKLTEEVRESLKEE